MILDQNYRNIADLTSKVFRLYARRVFAQAVKDTYEKRKLLGFDKGGHDEMRINQFNPSAISGIIQNFPQMSQNNDQTQFRRTLKSISSLQSHEAQKQSVYQLFYGDLVFILKVQDHINDIQEKLFMGCEMNSIQGCRGLRGFQINMRKYLFKLIHPHQKFGIIPGPKTKFTQNSPICLMNIQTGKYIKLIKNQIPKKVFGFKVSLSDTITSDTIFLPVKTGDKFVQTSKQIFTSSYFKLMLRQNNYFKINIKQQDKIALIQTNTYSMLANYDGCELSFLKQNIQAPNRALIQNPPMLFPQVQPIKCYKSYYIRSDTGFYLASQQRKIGSGMKEMTYNMFSEGIGRYNVIVDQFTNPSIQIGDISVINAKQHDNLQYNLHSVWELKKNNIFSSLDVKTGDDIFLMNVATGEHIVYHRNSRKAKFSLVSESYKILITDDKYRFKLPDGNFLGCRRNHAEDKYQIGFQQSDSYFIIEQVNVHANNILSKVHEIYRVLKNSYKYIWLWGLEKQGNKNQVDYNFNRAARDEYLLKIQITILNQALEQIDAILCQQDESSHRLCQFQNLIKKSKILQILIYFCKLFLIKRQPIKKSKKNTQQRTVFMIAKRNIQPTLLLIIGVLRRSCKNNKQCSSIIIQFSYLFNSLLATYPQEVGSMLKQSIKNLSMLNLNYKGEELFQWVKLLQKPRKQNIQTLNIYISIVSEVVIDPFDRGIQAYQIKCVQFLFNLHGNMKTRNFLLGFHLNEKQEPIIQFSYTSQKQLLANNPALQQVVCDDEKSYCSLIALSNRSKNNPALNSYLIYVYEVIRLYRNLCKDRNKKMSIQMQSIGIKQPLIVKIIRSQSIDAKLKMAFLSLYLQIYIDQDPYVPFTKHQNRCFKYQSIPSKNLNCKTYFIFNPSPQSKSSIQLSQFIISFIDGYIATSLNELESGQHISESMCIHIIYIVKFIKASVDFGYFQANIIIFKVEGLLTLLLLLLQRISNNEQYQNYVATIVLQMTDFLWLYKRITVQLSILSFMKVLYIQTKQEFTLFLRQNTTDMIKYFLSSYLTLQKRKIRTEQDKDIRQDIKRNIDNSFRNCQQKIQSFLLQILIQLHAFKNKPFYQTFIKIVDKNILIHLEIQKQLQNYEVVIGKDQIKIADELNNNHSTRILNANKLQQQVSKLIGQQQITCEQRTTLIIQISNLLRKIIKKLGEYRVKGKKIVNVAQRIIEKNQTFNSVKKILIQCSNNKQFKQLILVIHHFIYEMILDNHSLSIKLCSQISCIIRVLNSAYIPKIIYILFPNVTNRKTIFTEINNTMIFKTHIRQAGFKTMRAALKSLAKQERKQLIKIIITTLFLEPSFKRYLDINQMSHETRQFIKLLIFLIKNNQQLRKQMRDVFPQRDIEVKMVESAYQNKSIYLQLLLHIHFVNPAQQQYVSEHTLIRLILPQLQNFFVRINEFSDERLLNHMKQNDQRNDPSQIQQKYREFKDIIHSWKVTQFKQHQQNVKKRTTKKRTYLMVEETQNFWQFFYSWDQQKYYLVTFVRQALQLGILKISNYSNQFNEPNSTSLLRSKKERQAVKQQLILAKHVSDIGNLHQPNIALNNKFAKTQPMSFKQFEVYRPYQEILKIKQLFRQMSCLVSRLIIKYHLRCQQIVKFNNSLSWICILLGESSIYIQDRSLIDKIFRQSDLSKYKSSKTQSTYLEKIFYLVGKMLYKNVSVTDIFQVFNVQQNEFIKYTDQQQSKTKSQVLERKDFVLKMQILYQKSQFQLVEPVKFQNLTQQQQQTYKQIQQTQYIFKATRINFFNELYSQLSKTSGFKHNQYWFIKKLLDILRCLKNKHLQQIIKDGKKHFLDYERNYWQIYQWIFDMKDQVLQNLHDNKHMKLQQYAQKFNQIITTKMKNSETTPQAQLQSLFINFTGIYTVHHQNSFMDRLMLVYFDIINKQNIKINIPTSLMIFILERLFTNHSETILQIIKMFFILAKTKFVGAQIDFETLKKNIYSELKYIEINLIQSNIEGEAKILSYFSELIKMIESFRQLPSTNNKEVITYMNQSLLQMLERLSINKKHPHLIFKTTIFYLEQIEENIINIFNCQSFVSYIYQKFHDFPVNIYVIPLQRKEDMHNLALFFAVPRKLRSLKMYKYLYKMIQSSGLKYPFLKLMGGYVNWNGRQTDVQQKNQIGDEFALDVHHRLIMLFQISYQMYHMNYENFRQLIQPQIKYLQLYSQARLKTDQLTKQIKTHNHQNLQYGQQVIIEAFQFYINSNCRIQIMKNQQPIEIFFTKPKICYHFNDDIKEQALKEIDKHHKQNLHQYINQISIQVTNSLKIQESLSSFGFGRFTMGYQKIFEDVMYYVMLAIFILILIIQSTNYYQNAKYLKIVIAAVFFFRFIQYIAKIGNLLRGYCKFKQRWCVSFLKEVFGFVYITQFFIIITLLFASVSLQLFSIAFFLETLLCRSIREYIQIMIGQYIILIKFLLFLTATCIFGSLLFAHYHGNVNLPIQYFATALKAMLATKVQNSGNHLEYTGQMIIYYMSQYIFCILSYTLMSAIIGTTVQTNSKPYLYNCLICLKPKQTFAIKGSAAFKKHIIQQHNFWNYLFYFIHLENKQNQIKTVDDIYVEKCIKEKNWMFLKM